MQLRPHMRAWARHKSSAAVPLLVTLALTVACVVPADNFRPSPETSSTTRTDSNDRTGEDTRPSTNDPASKGSIDANDTSGDPQSTSTTRTGLDDDSSSTQSSEASTSTADEGTSSDTEDAAGSNDNVDGDDEASLTESETQITESSESSDPSATDTQTTEETESEADAESTTDAGSETGTETGSDAHGSDTDVTEASEDSTGDDTFYPRSCEEVRMQSPLAGDGVYTLYVENDVSRPWQAYCAAMDIGPSEYLELQNIAAGQNYSSYHAGGTSVGTTVTTSYEKIRIYPDSFAVNIENDRFTTSEGSLMHGTTTVRYMPYGVAMSCEMGALATANIDLRGTPFRVASEFCAGGALASHVATPSANGQLYDLQGGGFCGWVSPTPPCANDPFNGSGGAVLTLEYIGPLPAAKLRR